MIKLRTRPATRKRLGAAGLAIAIVALAALLTPALASAASPPLPFLETFGSANQPTFTGPEGLAVDQSTGDVLVIEPGNNTVSRWKPDGTAANFSALGTNVIDGKKGPGGLACASEPASCDETESNSGILGTETAAQEVQVAVDNSGTATNGDIYVTDSSENRIDVFASTGHYLGSLKEAGTGTNPFSNSCGVAIDGSGTVYVGNFGGKVDKFVPTANPPTNANGTVLSTATSSPCGIAAGTGPTAGYIFVHGYGASAVNKVNTSTGAVQYGFGGGVGTYRALTVDPANGRVYLAADSGFQQYNASAGSAPSEPPSEPISQNTPGLASLGIAVNGTSGHVYIAQATGTKLAVYGSFLSFTVVKGGNGDGTVTSLAPHTGIDCLPGEEECAEAFELGAEVELEASPQAGSVFAGWVGCKRVSATACTVTTTAGSEVTAIFFKEAKNGEPGTAGTNGTTGPQGPQGPEGKQGPQGPAGRDAKVTCTVKRKGKKVKVTCKVRYPASTSSARLRWNLRRAGRTVSHGTTRHGRLNLGNLRRGRYVLRVQGQRKGTVIVVS